MMRLLRVLFAYFQAKRLTFTSRAALENYQQRKLHGFRKTLIAKSPYYAKFANLPIEQWPEMSKALMLLHFDQMNTAGLKLQQVFDIALAAEQSRNFKPKQGNINLGLSSGTSGQRGVFAISDKEAAQWAGVMLAKMLPKGLFAGERVALFLRANSNVYEAVQCRWLTFRFFDLFKPLEENLAALLDYQVSIIVAPAQVLRELALRVIAGEIQLRPKRVISVAEVLDPLDRSLIEQAFQDVHQVYQATEGFLASSCEHGVLHLNEEYLHIEPDWLDQEQRRFVPIVTDFMRLTQPFVRYRLNDVLIARQTACPCGRVTRALDAVEGRCDDMLRLPGKSNLSIAVFADLLSRIFARALPRKADYQLIQTAAADLRLHANIDEASLQQLKNHLCQIFEQLGIESALINWELHTSLPAMESHAKRRRIIRNHYV